MDTETFCTECGRYVDEGGDCPCFEKGEEALEG